MTTYDETAISIMLSEASPRERSPEGGVTERQFWMPPAGEPVQIRFLDPPPLLQQEVPARSRRTPLAHTPGAPCVFCWMEAERKLRAVELDRWADDGGPTT